MYQRILIAADSVQGSVDRALEQARAVANPGAKLTLLHVIEPTTIPYSIDPSMTGRAYESQEDGLLHSAREHMQNLCAKHDFSSDDIAIVIGRPAAEIHKLAVELDCDLISIASHGRHGWQLLLGSTANAILHGTKCDVLVSKLADK